MHLLCCLGDAVAGCDDCLADGGGDSLWVDDFLCSAAFDFTTESMANDLPELVCHVCWLGRDSGDQQSICTGARSAAFLDGVGDLCCLVSVCASPVTACAFARSDSTIINHYGSPGLVVSDRLSGQF